MHNICHLPDLEALEDLPIDELYQALTRFPQEPRQPYLQQRGNADSSSSHTDSSKGLLDLSFNQIVDSHKQENHRTQSAINAWSQHEPLDFQLYHQMRQQKRETKSKTPTKSGLHNQSKRATVNAGGQSRHPDAVTAINTKSKTIIEKKEKEGKKYIPIHLRTQCELEKKQSKIQKIKTEVVDREQEKILKQCTFKPQTYSKAPIRRDAKELVQSLYGWNQRVKSKLEQKKKEKQNSEIMSMKGPELHNSSLHYNIKEAAEQQPADKLRKSVGSAVKPTGNNRSAGFTPKGIEANAKKPSAEKQQLQSNQNGTESQRKTQFSAIPQKRLQQQQESREAGRSLTPTTKKQPAKNKKFNILLDLIGS